MQSLKSAREAAGLTVAELARRTTRVREGRGDGPLVREALSRAEREGYDPRASLVADIAKALGVPVCELFEKAAGHGSRGRKRRSKQP